MIHPNKPLIEAAILKGEKYAWIEAEYKCSQMIIKRYKVRMGIELRKRKLTEGDVQMIIKMKGTATQTAIGKRFGVSNVMINKIFKKVA